MSESKHTGNPDGDRFTKLEGAEYDRVNDFLRDRTYLTAREWAVLRVSDDLRSEFGVPTKEVGQRLPDIVPFITDEFSRQNVHNTRAAAKEKAIKAGATFLYATMAGGFDAEETDDIMYEATEVAKFLLETEGASVSVDDEIRAEEDVSDLLREIRRAASSVEPDETNS